MLDTDRWPVPGRDAPGEELGRLEMVLHSETFQDGKGIGAGGGHDGGHDGGYDGQGRCDNRVQGSSWIGRQAVGASS